MRRPQADLDLQLERDQFAPGDKVTVRVNIASDKGFRVKAGIIALTCVETFWRSEYNAATKTSSLNKHTQKLVEIPLQFMNDGQVRRGIAHREELSLSLPDDVPVTLIGKNANVSWQVKLALDVPGARDLHQERPITVLPSPPRPQDPNNDFPSTTVTEQSYSEFRMRLELPAGDFRVGESVAGTLRLDADQDRDISELRVELLRHEEAGDKKSKDVADETVLETDNSLLANRSREWRFRLTIPPGLWPSSQTSKTSIAWSVKAVVDRSRRRDYSVEKLIQATIGI